MAGGRALSFRKRKGPSPLHPPLRKETAFSRYFSGMGASYVEIAWLGRRMGGGCSNAACAFRMGASDCRKERACAALNFRAEQAAHCAVLPESSMRFPGGGGEQLPKSTRLYGAGFSRKAKPRTAPHRMKTACAFRVGASNCRKKTRLCGNGFSRKAKPHTPPHRMNAPCAFREGGGEQLPKSTRLCGAGFSRKASRALHRIA